MIFIKTIAKWWLLIAGGIFLFLGVLISILLIQGNTPQESIMDVSGRNQLNFQVHYLPNPLFPNGPEGSVQFLRNFVDYIEITNNFSADISESLTINYRYTIRTNMTIHYGNTTGPVVFELEHTLAEGHGTTYGAGISLPQGIYTIDLDHHMLAFETFMFHHERFLDDDVTGFRSFTPQLNIEFIHTIETRPTFMTHTIINGFEIPLGQNVFTLTQFGQAGFSDAVMRHGASQGIGIGWIILILGLILLGLTGLLIGYMRLEVEENQQKKQVAQILKKYDTEIVQALAPMRLYNYQRVKVNDFDELLKLSINLGKHITFYTDKRKASFTLIVDTMAYQHIVSFAKQVKNDNPTRIEELMATLDMHTYELSETADVNIENITKMIDGKLNPLISQTSSIANVLGVSIEELFNISPDK